MNIDKDLELFTYQLIQNQYDTKHHIPNKTHKSTGHITGSTHACIHKHQPKFEVKVKTLIHPNVSKWTKKNAVFINNPYTYILRTWIRWTIIRFNHLLLLLVFVLFHAELKIWHLSMIQHAVVINKSTHEWVYEFQGHKI